MSQSPPSCANLLLHGTRPGRDASRPAQAPAGPLPGSRPMTGEATEPVVAVCDSLVVARALARALERAGFDPAAISVVGHGEEAMPPTVDERLRRWIGLGGVVGALGGLAAGVALVLPPMGLLLAVGPLLTVLLAMLEAAAVGAGLSAIVGLLTSAGLRLVDALDGDAQSVARRFVVFVHGTRDDETRARELARAAGMDGARVA
jgi:hypothetical protein